MGGAKTAQHNIGRGKITATRAAFLAAFSPPFPSKRSPETDSADGPSWSEQGALFRQSASAQKLTERLAKSGKMSGQKSGQNEWPEA